MTSNQTFESRRSRLAHPKRSGASCTMLLIVLVSGLLAGVGLTVIYDLDDKATEFFGLPPKPKKTRSIAEMRDSIADRYAVELGLSDEQKSKVSEVLTEHFSSSLQQRIQMLEKLSVVLVPMLSDAKRAEWEELKAQRIKKWGENTTAE